MKPRILSAARLSLPLATALAALVAATSAKAATSFKLDNTDPLSLPSSWDTVPGATDIAQWDFAVTGANSTLLGADLSWGGIKIVDPGTVPGTQPVTIGAGNTLTIGTSGIDLSTATQNLILNCGLTLEGAQSWRADAGLTLDVAGTFTRSGATVDFTNFNATATLGTLVNDASGILGPWAKTGSGTALQYVTSTAGALSAYAGATADAGNLASLTGATTNYSYGAAATVEGSQTGNTLRYTGGATTTALGVNDLTLNGLMHAGSGKLTISGTPGSPGLVIGASGVLDVITNGQAMDITSNISGTGVVVYSGGTFTLGLGNLTNSFNTYSGSTVVNSGTVTNAATGSASTPYFGTGPVTFNPGTTLGCNRTQVANAITFNNATVTGGNSFTSTLSGPITLVGNVTVSVTGNLTFSNNIGGSGGLTKTGSAFVPLNGAVNDYAGPTTIGVNGGGLTIKSSIYGNDTLKWTPDNITVNSGGALVMNVGGAGEFTIAQAGTMFSQLGGEVNNNGLRAGSTFGIDTRTSGGSFVISDNLIDSSGTGGGSINFRIVGNGATGGSTVELTGNNTYSGLTVVDRSGTVKVSSLNSVDIADLDPNLPLATSSLGRPTTVANGTIQLGASTSFQGGNLNYTGTGETTDRVVNFGGANNSIYTFTQSGAGPDPMAMTSGLLKFTSNFTMTDLRGPQTVVLQGSTSGTGEMAGVLPGGDGGNSNRLTKSGTGTWTLSGANLFGGVTTLTDGVLSVATISDGGVGGMVTTTTANNATVNLTTGTTAGLAVGMTVVSNAIPPGRTIASIVSPTQFTLDSGTGVAGAPNRGLTAGTPSNLGLAPGVAANLVFNGGTLQYTGATASTNRNFTINAGKTATLDITTNNLTLSGASTATSGALTKTGAGTLTLTGANLYSGATAVNQGTLLVNNTTGSGTGTGNVSVATGTLGGSGSIAGTVTIGDSTGAADAILAPGNSIESIDTGSLSFNSDGSFACELDGDSATSDRANVTGTVTIDAATTLVVSLGGSLAGGQKYFIVVNDDVDAVTGTFAGLAQDGVVGNYGGTDLKISYTGDSGSGALTGGNDIVLHADGVASPYATWAALKGLTGAPGFEAGKADDPDKDGKDNLSEFAFDGDPLSGSNDGKVVGKIATAGADEVMTLTLPVRNEAVFANDAGDQLSALIDGIYYRVEGSADLGTFADTITEVVGGDAAAIQSGLPALSTGWTYRSFRAPGTVPSAAKAFLRAKVTETP
jgi:autotransporter-associated beta strand protein